MQIRRPIHVVFERLEIGTEFLLTDGRLCIKTNPIRKEVEGNKAVTGDAFCFDSLTVCRITPEEKCLVVRITGTARTVSDMAFYDMKQVNH